MRLMLYIRQALDAISANAVRAGMAIFIIALGITAVIGVQTSVAGMRAALTKGFSTLGANTFRIENRISAAEVHGRGRSRQRTPRVNFQQAMNFKQRFEQEAPVSISARGGMLFQVRHGLKQTNPNITLLGTDENYLKTARYTIAEGRAITREDVLGSAQVAVLGAAVKKSLFPSESAIGKKVNISGLIYYVIGDFEEMGSMSGIGGDKSVCIPVTTLRADFPSARRSFSISVYVENVKEHDRLVDEATGAFRLSRGLKPREATDFSIIKSDAMIEDMMDNLKVLTEAAKYIALIALLGAAIALLNVMLASVTERTKEIGLRKAMGATKGGVMLQFLNEAIVICQLGGIFGIALGMLIGNLISVYAMKTHFIAPWGWIVMAFVACLVVGVLAGLYPAWKAARVDPIESLRYE